MSEKTKCQICFQVIPPGVEHEHMCPICLIKQAISPHHILPRSLGGTDDRRNIVYLCLSCHDLVEMIQEKTGKSFSPDMIEQIRQAADIKLGKDKDGVSHSYKTICGKTFLLWVILGNGTQKIVNQFVDGYPDELIPKEPQESKPLDIPAPTHRGRGRPFDMRIDTQYLAQLVEQGRGKSLREIQHMLHQQGIDVSHEFIRKRINGVLPWVRLKECPHCHKKFDPGKDRRIIFCSPECYTAVHRKPRKTVGLS
jgi:hypothetical protein